MKAILKDISDVLILNITTISISFTAIESGLKIFLLILSIIYTVQKIRYNNKPNE
jgi:hypothetical protein